MRFITSNIRFDNPADNEHAWEHRKALLASTLLDLKPSIIASQEGLKPQLLDFLNLLSPMTLNTQHRDWIEHRMYPCLYSYDLEPISSGDFWLSHTPQVAGSKLKESAFPRLCTWVKVMNEGDLYTVFDTHLDHTTDKARELQAQVLVSEIKKINPKLEKTIILGDFNSRPDSKVYNYILEELNLIDPWVVHGLAEETSFHSFKGVNPDGARIDWIFHSKDLESQKIGIVKDQKNGIFPSDHFPIFCDIIKKN